MTVLMAALESDNIDMATELVAAAAKYNYDLVSGPTRIARNAVHARTPLALSVATAFNLSRAPFHRLFPPAKTGVTATEKKNKKGS